MTKNDKGKTSLVLVIIFGLLGIGIINAGLHDAYYFGQYEDLVPAFAFGLILV